MWTESNLVTLPRFSGPSSTWRNNVSRIRTAKLEKYVLYSKSRPIPHIHMNGYQILTGNKMLPTAHANSSVVLCELINLHILIQ